jgi:RNA polymerase sigma factor (sigma-70 family)
MTPDQARLLAIVGDERRLIYSIARRLGVAEVDLPDVRQLVLLTAWRALVNGRLVVPPGADERIRIRKWLHVVVRNQTLTFKRQKPIGEALTHDPPGEDMIARLEARDALRVAFYRVNRAERTVLRGVAMGDTLAEIAAEMRIPQGSVSTHLYRVRKALKKQRVRGR